MRSRNLVSVDGERIWVRPLERNDRGPLARSFDRLSDRSRTYRFLGPKPFLTVRELMRLVDVDHLSRAALVAIDPSDGSIIGVARYAMLSDADADADADADGVAEVAFEVIDERQGRGIGRELTAG